MPVAKCTGDSIPGWDARVPRDEYQERLFCKALKSRCADGVVSAPKLASISFNASRCSLSLRAATQSDGTSNRKSRTYTSLAVIITHALVVIPAIITV